ncbi:hypothetical protein ES707_11741 [subsurface metagenome]
MFIGQSLDPSGVIKGVQIAEHRLLFPIDIHLANDKLRHQIAYSKYKDDNIMSNGGITLIDFIDQCKAQNVIPIVNLNFFVAYRKNNWTSLIPSEQYGRCSRIVADLLTENFNLAVIAPLNEPRKWLDDNTTGIYTESAYNSLTPAQHSKIKFSVGNEEYIVSLFQHLGNRFRGKSNVMFGAHLLSSMGNWDNPRKYFNRISDWKDLADSYGLGILNIEGGAWFNSYCTYEGHNINKDIIKISKQNGYWASNVVVIDNNNMPKYRRLGYRKYNNEYTGVPAEPMMNKTTSYFKDFMNFIKREGQKVPVPEPVIEEEDMRLENFYYQNRSKNLIKIDPKGYGIRFLRACFDLPDSNIFDEILDAKVRQYQIENKLLIDGKVGPETFGSMIKVADFYKHYCWAHSLWARGL